MFAHVKQAVLLYHPDRSQVFHAPRGYIGTVPDWVAQSRQARRMVRDGSLILSEHTGGVEEKPNKKPAARSRKEGGT